MRLTAPIVGILILGLSCGAAPAEDAAAVEAAVASEPVRTCHYIRTDLYAAEQVCIGEAGYFADVCDAIATYAKHWSLPVGYFARLIWQESRFNPQALSHAGAAGIAQFMPSTGSLRGLRNAFDPAEALARSAEYLKFLERKYGNLGLAAAAYNSGEGRVSRWLAAGGYLPAETRNYVEIVTGRGVEQWLDEELESVDFSLQPDTSFQDACLELAHGREPPRLDSAPSDTWKPWGVMIAQDFSRDVALRRFRRVQAEHAHIFDADRLMFATGRNARFGSGLRHMAMVGAETRQEAEELCRRLTAAGASCMVRRN